MLHLGAKVAIFIGAAAADVKSGARLAPLLVGLI
jgi:hypothetical protein